MSHPFNTASSPENNTGPTLAHKSEEMPEEIGNQNRVMGSTKWQGGNPTTNKCPTEWKALP